METCKITSLIYANERRRIKTFKQSYLRTTILNNRIFAIISTILLSCLIGQVKSLQCVQCSTDTDPHCKCNPPPPRECITAMYDHCITVKEKDNQGKVTVFTRSCSPEDLKDECITGRTPEGKFKKICYTTCTSDGCNKEELINDCEPGSRTEEEIAKLKGLKEKVIEEAEKKKETIDENVKKIDEKIESEIGKIKAKSGAFSSIKFCISGTLLMAFNVFFVILLNL